VEDVEITSSMNSLLKKGLYACPEAAATLAGLKKLENQHVFDSDESILLYLTGNAMKYFNATKTREERVPVLKQNADSLD
jgi:threonine synthase